MSANTILIDNYVGLINNLEPKYKIKIIEKISKSLRISNRKSSKKSTFGAFVSNNSAEEIIEEIKSSRKFNRQIEAF